MKKRGYSDYMGSGGGGDSDDEDSFSRSLPHPLTSPSPIKPKYYALLYIVLFLLLGCYYPPLDYHNLLLPKPSDAAMTCSLVGITSYQNITEYDVVGRLAGDRFPILLYSTTVVRTMSCSYVVVGGGGVEDEPIKYVYRTPFINISHIDVDREVEIMLLKFETPTKLWKYDIEEDNYLLRGVVVDRYGFSEEPVDIYRDYLHAYIIMKVCTGGVALALVLIIMGIMRFMRYMGRSGVIRH
jgi:hypothetical protein